MYQGAGPVADLHAPGGGEAAPGVNVMHQQGQSDRISNKTSIEVLTVSDCFCTDWQNVALFRR